MGDFVLPRITRSGPALLVPVPGAARWCRWRVDSPEAELVDCWGVPLVSRAPVEWRKELPSMEAALAFLVEWVDELMEASDADHN